MKYYLMDKDEVINTLKTSSEGLTIEDAQKRLRENGKNKLKAEKRESNLAKFIKEFRDLMIIVLIIAAIISFILALINHESFTDSIIIIAIVIINAIMGFVQELKADKALAELKKMQVAKAKVKRCGKIQIIDSEDLVVGDIILLEAGDTVPADARIINEVKLKVDESSLTGESLPVHKSIKKLDSDVELAARNNMIYLGTNVLYGKCQAVVVATGMNTEFGLIALSLNEEIKEVTPLQKKIDGISKFLSFIIAIIVLLMFIVGVIKGMELKEVIMLAISLAVAAIPEGLPAVITITLSLGVSQMAKKKAIVRKMSSVETLGCTEVICSDKTGTITQNKMTVREIYFDNTLQNIEDVNKSNMLLEIMALNNDVEKNEDYIGEPTEVALYQAAEKVVDIKKLRENNERVFELPFDSERKMMSTIHENKKDFIVYTKGSFDAIINNANYIYLNGKEVKLNQKMKDDLKRVEEEESNKAYRILAYAYKNIDKKAKLADIKESDLVFVGLSAMIDPPRENVKEAILACKSAHIRPIMITGDSVKTASAIAKEIGILNTEDEAISGKEIDNLSLEQLKDVVNKYNVYARVSPTNKLNIVKALMEQNKIVAMTGDGVNDAPALKAANIGVGMGITGTEVSKNVSDIILSDDSFVTIVSAVREGRRIFDNIRNVIVYLLTGNITEILVVFICSLFGVEIFLPIQLLYINLITDSIPAIALSFEAEDDGIMKRPIRKNDKTFFTPFLLAKMGLSAILKSVIVLVVYFINYKLFNIGVATTSAFLTLVALELIYAYSCRNLKKSVINKKFFKNKYLNICTLILVLLQVIIFATPLRSLFKIEGLTFLQIGYALILVLVVFIIDELAKKILVKLFRD